VLDEDEQSSQYLKESLGDLGYQVDLRQSISDFQIAELDLARFDLVICDSDIGLGVWKFLLNRIRLQRLDTHLVLASMVPVAERKLGQAVTTLVAH
jgi:hypothetical protein